MPVINPSFDKFGSEDTKHGICVTWLGHACVLVQIDGMKILADPVFSSKCGPKFGVQLGYTRYREAPCSVESLPDIDAVIISHNHYDHLDYNTVCQLADRFHDLKWFVPVGVKAFMESCQCKNVEECEWWKGHSHKNVRFTFVPAQHWSKRGLMDDNVVGYIALFVMYAQLCHLTDIFPESIRNGHLYICLFVKFHSKV